MKALKIILENITATVVFLSLVFAGASEPDGSLDFGWSFSWIALATIVALISGWHKDPAKK